MATKVKQILMGSRCGISRDVYIGNCGSLHDIQRKATKMSWFEVQKNRMKKLAKKWL